MIIGKKAITAEQYKRAMENNGIIAECDKPDIFTDAELYGYGIYRPQAYTNETGNYLCVYWRGESCD